MVGVVALLGEMIVVDPELVLRGRSHMQNVKIVLVTPSKAGEEIPLEEQRGCIFPIMIVDDKQHHLGLCVRADFDLGMDSGMIPEAQ